MTSASPMADMQGSRGIGGDVFNLDFFACAKTAVAVSLAAIQNLRYDLLFGGGFEKQVDEASACDFRFFYMW